MPDDLDRFLADVKTGYGDPEQQQDSVDGQSAAGMRVGDVIFFDGRPLTVAIVDREGGAVGLIDEDDNVRLVPIVTRDTDQQD